MTPRKNVLRKLKKPSLNKVSFNGLIPNILTLINLCAGFSAVHFAFLQRWEHAVGMIMIAGLLDGLDGRIARLMGVTSRFGAELDSLGDFLSFGIAPPLLMYLYTLKEFGKWGWLATLLFAVCGALRLARFNVLSIEIDKRATPLPSWSNHFFVGLPIPAAGSLILLPLLVALEIEISVPSFISLCWIILISLLMVSRIPTFSFKATHFSPKWILPLFLAIGIIAAGLITSPWLTLISIGTIYLFSIPFSIRQYKKLSLSAAPSASIVNISPNNSKTKSSS